MAQPNGDRVRVLLLFSDTGGGHRSAANALIEAWHADHPGRVDADMVDVFRDHAPAPFHLAGPTYPGLVEHFGWLYAGGFRLTNGRRRFWSLARLLYRQFRPYLLRLLRQRPADVIVSVHPLFNHGIDWARRELGLAAPLVTVVTDLHTGHAGWFYPDVARLIVPTAEAGTRARLLGVPPGRVVVRGQPVARKFTTPPCPAADRPALRRRLGLAPEGRVVLLSGGGDGMGPLEALVRELDAARAPAQVVVIAGRNAALRERLLQRTWRVPVRVEGFVSDMPEWMAAADVLVTKAGPGSIAEGLLSGLPLLLTSKVPGQEDGNVDYVVSKGVGAWEPAPRRAAARVCEWLRPDNPALGEMARRARGLVDPGSTAAIAADILAVAARRDCGAGSVTVLPA